MDQRITIIITIITIITLPGMNLIIFDSIHLRSAFSNVWSSYHYLDLDQTIIFYFLLQVATTTTNYYRKGPVACILHYVNFLFSIQLNCSFVCFLRHHDITGDIAMKIMYNKIKILNYQQPCKYVNYLIYDLLLVRFGMLARTYQNVAQAFGAQRTYGSSSVPSDWISVILYNLILDCFC